MVAATWRRGIGHVRGHNVVLGRNNRHATQIRHRRRGPLPGTEVKVVDPRTDETLSVDAIGEICARSFGVMTAYFDDLGSMDASGYCRIQGRLKDMIIRGGENIYPREIEDILHTHPGVAHVAVTGGQGMGRDGCCICAATPRPPS
jgi:acyl-CoA synthetase (AMP-forming)/AMP-acid ligase II